MVENAVESPPQIASQTLEAVAREVNASLTEARARTRQSIPSGEGFLLEQYLCATPQVPLLPATASLADGLVQQIVRCGRPERGHISHPETPDGFGDELEF